MSENIFSPIIFSATADLPPQAGFILSTIQESFFTRSVDFEEIGGWLWGVGATVLLLLAYIAVRAILARRVRYKPFGTINEPHAIRGILRTALDQRRSFEMQFHISPGHRRPALRCALEYIGPDSLTLEAGGLKSLSDKWLGCPASIFFRIRTINRDFAYYTFVTRITGIYQPRKNICQLILAVPELMENRQKRAFLRIDPPRGSILGAALWHGNAMPQGETLLAISNWPKPHLLFLPGRMEQFQILDISAGGVRMRIPNSVMRTFALQFSFGQHLLLMLELVAPEQQNPRQRFWMECRIQNAWKEYTSRDLHVGVQFLSWARPKDMPGNAEEATSADIEWLRLSAAQEVESLGNWVMRRHLETFRETPLRNEYDL